MSFSTGLLLGLASGLIGFVLGKVIPISNWERKIFNKLFELERKIHERLTR